MKRVSFVQERGFSSVGSNLWSVATRHQASKNHIMSYTSYKLLGNLDVASALDEARKRAIEAHNQNASRYAQMLTHHIKAAVYLSAQGLAFRGHDEAKLSSNRGNFLELLELLGTYSHDFKAFLDKEQITYTSHEPQNELIQAIYQEVCSEIQVRIHKSRYVSVMMDDTSDYSNTEQSAVSVRLIHEGKVEEHLLSLVDASEDYSAEGLSKVMLDTLECFDVKPETSSHKLIGQSYDGASTMSGNLNGVQKRIRDRFPYAYYTHCVAHRMALCAKQSANKIQSVSDFFDTTDKIIKFFRSSAKRTRNLGQNLPKPGDTRWLSRDSAISVIDTSYEEIGNALFFVANNTEENGKTRKKAKKLIPAIQNIQFIFLLKVYRKIFEHCSPIVLLTQKPTFDVVQLKSMLSDFLTVINKFDLSQIWRESLSFNPVFPIIAERVGWRGIDEQNDGSEEMWKTSLFATGMELVAEFSSQICWRFENIEMFKWVELVHPSKFTVRKISSSQEQREMIETVKELYPFIVADTVAIENNLNVLYHCSEISLLLQQVVRERDELAAKRRKEQYHTQEQDAVDQEMETFGVVQSGCNAEVAVEEADPFEVSFGTEIELENLTTGSAGLQDLLNVIRIAELQDALPHVVLLLELAITVPLTSVHCERVFSRMKRVVSTTRSRMMQSRKTHLVLLQVEHHLLRYLASKSDFHSKVLMRFKMKNRRRFQRFSKK